MALTENVNVIAANVALMISTRRLAVNNESEAFDSISENKLRSGRSVFK